MEIRQGDLFWVNLGPPSGSQPGYKRPYVVMPVLLFARDTSPPQMIIRGAVAPTVLVAVHVFVAGL